MGHKLGGVLLLLLFAFAQQLVLGQQELEGSGDAPEETTPALGDDYVNCPPPSAIDGYDTSEDYYDYEDYKINNPKIGLDEVNDLLENSDEVDLVSDPLLAGKTEEENENKLEVDDDVEEVSDADGIPSTIKLLNASAIYSLPDTEPIESRFEVFLEEHLEEVVLTSPNYPAPYPSNVNDFKEYSITGGIGIQITIHDVDLDQQTDFLYIRGGAVNDTGEKGPVFTGTIKSPMRFLVPHTTTFSVHFVSQHDESIPQTHKGFRLTYAPFGTVVSPTPSTTTEMSVPREELQWLRKEISMSKEMIASNSTWPIVKTGLMNAANLFIEKYQLKYKPSRPEDVRLRAYRCPDTWPMYEECLTLEFAIPLRPIIEIEEDPEEFGLLGKANPQAKGFIPLTTTVEPEAEYQLTEENLNRLWNEIGAMKLAEEGIEVYRMPENSSVLLIWITISLCIVAAFIFVLYSIWKIDFFKDYRRISKLRNEAADEDRSELKKKEFDISMFPSPHQIVPSLFPTGDPYSDRNPEAEYAYDNSTMNPWAEEQHHEAKFDAFNDDSSNPNSRLKQQHQQQHPSKQQVFEPMSPLDYSPGIVDFNESPDLRSPRKSRINPFLTRGGAGGNDQP